MLIIKRLRLPMTSPLLDSYDPTLFQGATSYYLNYRPRYPQSVYNAIASEFQLDGKGRLLDLGCGTGLVAIALHKHFESVVGIDPDEAMLRVARREAAQAQMQYATWIHGLAENISPDLGTFRLMTIGRAFHWMDQELVLRRGYEMLEPGGGIAILQTEKDIWSNDARWATNVLAVIKRWLGERRRVGRTSVTSLYKSDLETLERSPFERVKSYSIGFKKCWTIENFIGYLYSTAYCRRDYFGGNIDDFEAEIKDAILSAEPSGSFEEEIPITLYLGFKDNSRYIKSV